MGDGLIFGMSSRDEYYEVTGVRSKMSWENSQIKLNNKKHRIVISVELTQNKTTSDVTLCN